jgi:hypothetical protein
LGRVWVDDANALELCAEREQRRLVSRELHAVRVPRVAADLFDEALLVAGAGFEPAVALKDAAHDFSRRD